MLRKINFKSKKTVIIGSIILVIVLCAILAVGASANKGANEAETYDYNETEQALAEEVKEYLSQYMSLPEHTSNAIADAAVQNYNIVMESGTDVINDEITDAVRKRIRSTIFAFADNPEQLTDDTLILDVSEKFL